MKIAILLLCHKNPQQINMFLDAMKHPAIEFFIHVDKKADIVEEIEHREDINFLPESERVSVEWGGWSETQAMLNLFSWAYKYDKYDFYWVCSGQDFPIKPVDQIVEFFRCNAGKNFVNLFTTLNNNGRFNHWDKRNSIYYPDWLFGRSISKRLLKRVYVELTGGYGRTYPLFLRKNTTGFRFYFGANWMALNQDVVEWVLCYVKKHPEYIEFFRHCQNPDESFFHTLFMNSPYKNNRKDYLHYVDWSEGGNSPRTLTLDDYYKMMDSSFLMARKIDIDVDSQLLKRLLRTS